MTRVLWIAVVAVASLAGSASAQVKLDWKFPEGSKSTTQIERKVHQTLDLGVANVESKSEQFLLVEATVGKRDQDGCLRVATRIQSMQAELDINGTKVSFSSTDPDKKTDNEELEKILQVFRVASKMRTTLVLDKDNRLQAVEIEGKPAEEVDEVFKDDFSPEQQKKVSEQRFQMLPDKPVQKGDTWKRTQLLPLGAGQTMTFETEYTYLGTVEQDGKTLDKIGARNLKVTYEQDPNAKSPLKVTKSDLKIESSTGTILFDREKGEIAKEESKTRIKGDMTLDANGQELNAKLDLTIEAKSTLQP